MKFVAAILLALAFGLAAPAFAENVRIKLLTPADAAEGLRSFRHEGAGPMDRAAMTALMERALDSLETPDAVIASARGDAVTFRLADGESLTQRYDEAAHAWDGAVWVVVLPH